jgi:hypothetical protein
VPKSQKTDVVMALWFAEIRARELTDEGFGAFHMKNPYATERQREAQFVVDLDELFAQNQTPNLGAL